MSEHDKFHNALLWVMERHRKDGNLCFFCNFSFQGETKKCSCIVEDENGNNKGCRRSWNSVIPAHAAAAKSDDRDGLFKETKEQLIAFFEENPTEDFFKAIENDIKEDENGRLIQKKDLKKV